MKLKTFQIVYNHIEIYDWVTSNIYSTSNSQSLSLILPTHNDRRFSFGGCQESALEWLMKRVVVKGCAELWNVSTLLKLNEHTASVSVSHTKLMLEQYDERRSNVYKNRYANLLLNTRHWSTELMIESLLWSLGNASRENTLKKKHTIGNPFFLGVSLVKFSSYGNSTKLDLSVHTLRTEYSISLAEFLLKLKECYEQYGFTSSSSQRPIENRVDVADVMESSIPWILVNAKISDITVFLFNKYDTCILLSLSEATVARTQQIIILKLDTFQTAILAATPSMRNSPISLSDFTDIFANVKLISVEYLRKTRPPLPTVNQINVFVLNDTEAMWNPSLHMHCVTLMQDMQEFRGKFSPHAALAPAASPTTEQKYYVEVCAEGSAVLGIKISDRHSMQIFVENFYLNRKDRCVISVEKIFINIDGLHIFTFRDVDMQSLSEHETLTAERSNYENFVLPTNRVWMTTIGSFTGIFPYDHDFSDAIQNEFVSLFKWLKIVHNVKKKEFTLASPLPSDMIIKIRDFSIEIGDDPFEVKLRDNYVLLVDEYHESIKREQLFRQKIQEMCADRLLLPAETLAELHASLVKKNSEIYIQRSKKINEAGPVRTRLFAWILTDLEIMAMADPSIHGKDNVIRQIRETDADSPWPEEGLDFVTLWSRAVNVSCSEWKFMLRDFPQPMFYVQNMRLFGNLCAAEQAATPRAKRDVQVEIGDVFGTRMIQRSMTSLKFYHDFDCDLDVCRYAFGPCWEPVSEHRIRSLN